MKLISLALLFFSVSAFANPIGKVLQINTSTQTVAVDLDQQTIEKGQSLIVTFENKSQCGLAVVSVKGSTAITRAKGCDQLNQLKVGTPVETSIENELLGENDKSQWEPVKATEQNSTSSSSANSSPITINEEWYLQAGIGFGGTQWNDENQRIIDQLESNSSIDGGTPISIELAIYFPTDDSFKTMLGPIIYSISQNYENTSTGDLFTAAQRFTGISGYHFYGENIGDKWYARADLGIVSYSVDYIPSDSSESILTAESDRGLGINLGGGYGFKIGSETRMTWGAMIGYFNADGNDTLNYTTSLGFLF